MYNLLMSGSTPIDVKKQTLLKHQPSAYLLGVLLLQLILFTIFNQTLNQHNLISAIGVAVLTAVMWVIGSCPGAPWLKWVLAAPAFILPLMAAALDIPALIAWAALADAVFYFYALASMIIYMMSDDRITTDELFAIIAAYMLLAWGFAYLYMVCQLWVPNSFTSPIVGDRPLVFNELLFISFTNQSSTGLSDISPSSSWARSLMMLDQMSGGIYIAVIVARLVGMIARKRSRKLD
jgi:hypothetical protein